MSPTDHQNLQRLSQNLPTNANTKKIQDVRFWRKGFDGKDNAKDQTYQWSDYGTRSVKIRFRVDQWHSNTMKLIKWFRSTTRTHSSLMRAFPFIVPLVFYVFLGYDVLDDGLNHLSVPLSVQFIRRMLTVAVFVLPTYATKFDLNKVIGMLLALLSMYLSRTIAPDDMTIPIHPILMVSGITALIVMACFHMELLFPFAFAGEKVRAYLTTKLDKQNNPVWIEESGFTAALGQMWDPQSHRCEKQLLSKLYPQAGIPDMYQSTIDFAVYKNMSTESLVSLFRARFWAFDLASSWPKYVKSADGTFFPLESIVLNPEKFRVKFEAGKHDEGVEGSDDELTDMDYEQQKIQWERKKEQLVIELKRRRNSENDDDLEGEEGEEEGEEGEEVKELKKTSSLFNIPTNSTINSRNLDRLRDQVQSQKEMFDGSDVYLLPPCELTPLNYPTTFLRTPRKVWSGWQTNIIKGMAQWWQSATSNWITTTILIVVFLEVFGAVSTYAGLQSRVTEKLLHYAEKYMRNMWTFGTDPLRHLYHHGPVIQTPFGTFGFWHGLSEVKICAAKSGSTFDESFWNSTPELLKKCLEDYKTWEDQFVNGTITLLVVYVVYLRFFKK